uniref:Protein AATF n=1 Tax=Caenorhabditis tropicalis TaxID=1561998 RepID=A0A1I7UGF6_9PELO
MENADTWLEEKEVRKVTMKEIVQVLYDMKLNELKISLKAVNVIAEAEAQKDSESELPQDAGNAHRMAEPDSNDLFGTKTCEQKLKVDNEFMQQIYRKPEGSKEKTTVVDEFLDAWDAEMEGREYIIKLQKKYEEEALRIHRHTLVAWLTVFRACQRVKILFDQLRTKRIRIVINNLVTVCDKLLIVLTQIESFLKLENRPSSFIILSSIIKSTDILTLEEIQEQEELSQCEEIRDPKVYSNPFIDIKKFLD